jgi:hypothetical protein
MNKALDTSNQQMQDRSDIDQYIQAQKDLKSSITETTAAYIKQAEAMLAADQAAVQTLADQKKNAFSNVTGGNGVNPFVAGDSFGNLASSIGAAAGNAAKYSKEYDDAVNKVAQDQARLNALNDIMTRQIKEQADIANRGTGDGSGGMKDRASRAIRDAQQAIDQMKALNDNVFNSPFQKEWTTIQDQINKQVEDFRDKLVDAKVPIQEVTALTQKYAAAVEAAKTSEFVNEHTVTLWEMLSDVIGKGFNSAVDNFIDAVTQGQDALKALGDVARTVVADILKQMLTLTVINPLLNSIFNSGLQVYGGIGTSGGGVSTNIISTLLGGLLGGSSGVTTDPIIPVTTMHRGGIGGASWGPRSFVSAAALAGAPTLHSGLKSDEFYAKLQAGETVIPKGGADGGGGGQQIVNVHNYTSTPVQVKKRQVGGRQEVDILFGAIMSKIGRGDGDATFKGRFGMAPAVRRGYSN